MIFTGGGLRWTTGASTAITTANWLLLPEGTGLIDVPTTATCATWFTTDNSTAAWPAWSAESFTAAQATIATRVFRTWVQSYTASPSPVLDLVSREPTAAELRQAERDATAYRWQERKRQRAHVRANRILRDHLTDEERQRLEAHGFFLVRTPAGRVYKVRKGIAGNVFLLDAQGQEVERLCVHPTGVPDGDAMLTQKLWLETAEDELRRIANITRLRAA